MSAPHPSIRTPHRAPLSHRGDDLYETPVEATLALLEVEPLPHSLWEPACGLGAMVRPLRAAGHRVIATDLVDYRSPDQDSTGRDFLSERAAPDGVQAIVTNPPFKIADGFVRHALNLCPRVVMLLRLAFLESERRSDILDGGQLARVYVFRNRLPMMHRAGWTGRKATNATAFAWFVWDRTHRGPPTLLRIPADRASAEHPSAARASEKKRCRFFPRQRLFSCRTQPCNRPRPKPFPERPNLTERTRR